jgi:hypothetical protein
MLPSLALGAAPSGARVRRRSSQAGASERLEGAAQSVGREYSRRFGIAGAPRSLAISDGAKRETRSSFENVDQSVSA